MSVFCGFSIFLICNHPLQLKYDYKIQQSHLLLVAIGSRNVHLSPKVGMFISMKILPLFLFICVSFEVTSNDILY